MVALVQLSRETVTIPESKTVSPLRGGQRTEKAVSSLMTMDSDNNEQHLGTAEKTVAETGHLVSRPLSLIPETHETTIPNISCLQISLRTSSR